MMGRMLHILQVPLLHGCYNESGRRLLDPSGLPGIQECHRMVNFTTPSPTVLQVVYCRLCGSCFKCFTTERFHFVVCVDFLHVQFSLFLALIEIFKTKISRSMVRKMKMFSCWMVSLCSM